MKDYIVNSLKHVGIGAGMLAVGVVFLALTPLAALVYYSGAIYVAVRGRIARRALVRELRKFVGKGRYS